VKPGADRRGLRRLARSFRCAFRGVGTLFAICPNFRIHLVCTVAVVMLAAWLRMPPIDWAILALAIGSVLTAEAFNTALESLADAVHPAEHPLVGRAKDLAAGAVVLAAAAAVSVAFALLMPRLFSLTVR
jgi:diacylglycerol kinase